MAEPATDADGLLEMATWGALGAVADDTADPVLDSAISDELEELSLIGSFWESTKSSSSFRFVPAGTLPVEEATTVDSKGFFGSLGLISLKP